MWLPLFGSMLVGKADVGSINERVDAEVSTMIHQALNSHIHVALDEPV